MVEDPTKPAPQPDETWLRVVPGKKGAVFQRVVKDGGVLSSRAEETIAGSSKERVAMLQQLALVQAFLGEPAGLNKKELAKVHAGEPFDVMLLPNRGEASVRDALKDVLKQHGGSPKEAELRAKEFREQLEHRRNNGSGDEVTEAADYLRRWDASPGNSLSDRLLALQLGEANVKLATYLNQEGSGNALYDDTGATKRIGMAINTLVPMPAQTKPGEAKGGWPVYETNAKDGAALTGVPNLVQLKRAESTMVAAQELAIKRLKGTAPLPEGVTSIEQYALSFDKGKLPYADELAEIRRQIAGRPTPGKDKPVGSQPEGRPLGVVSAEDPAPKPVRQPEETWRRTMPGKTGEAEPVKRSESKPGKPMYSKAELETIIESADSLLYFSPGALQARTTAEKALEEFDDRPGQNVTLGSLGGFTPASSKEGPPPADKGAGNSKPGMSKPGAGRGSR